MGKMMKDFDSLRNYRTIPLQVPKTSGDWLPQSPKDWFAATKIGRLPFTAFSIQIPWLFFLPVGFPTKKTLMLSHNCTAVVTEVVRKALTLTRHIAASQLLADDFRFELDTITSTFQVGIKTQKNKNWAPNLTCISSPPSPGYQNPPEQ